MENDISAEPSNNVVRDDAKRANAAPTARRRAGIGPLLILVALVVIAAGAWWLWRQQREQGVVRDEALGARLEESLRGNEQLRRDVDALRTRLADSEALNRSVREELLGAGERARALEDAVAHLADQRLTSRDAMALNEAEFVLQLGGERLGLFHDAAAAIAAYRLADSALAAAEDPLFASVRQTIGAEIAALEAAQPLQAQATLGALAKLRGAVPSLPARAPVGIAAPANDERSRFARVFGQFVRISTDTTTEALSTRDSGLARSLVALDLRAAEGALFARDGAAFASALAGARAEISAAFDVEAEPVRSVLGEIDRLAGASMAPNLPELGSALRELRNLRTTRALSRGIAAPVGAGATP